MSKTIKNSNCDVSVIYLTIKEGSASDDDENPFHKSTKNKQIVDRLTIFLVICRALFFTNSKPEKKRETESFY